MKGKKQVFQGSTSFGSQIQIDYPLFCARFTGLETRRAEWCKPLDDQSTVLQATNPESSSFVTPHHLSPARLKGVNPLLVPAVFGKKGAWRRG